MFQLDQNESYWYPVSIEMIDAEGRKRSFTFDAEFERLPQAELEDMMLKIKDGVESDNPVRDREIVERVFRRWRKVADADGSELTVTPENRERLLQRHPVQPSIVRAWLKSMGWEGRRKN
ncbi:MAG TPA: hypothetical protein PKZ76_03310 [Xanthomonadaceae bacterium]|nr:hypothetical protein [Xanthomonadaceae bacterium]